MLFVYKVTPLQVAASKGHAEIVAKLVYYRARMTGKLKGELNPLILAIQSGSEECVKSLVNAGADVNYANPNGESPLMAAVRTRNNAMFDLVMAKKPALNYASPKGETAMFVAVKCGYAQAVERFLEMKALDRNKVYPGGKTLVHVAAAAGQAGIVTKLLEAGWMPDDLDKDGETPLHDAAARGGNGDVIKVLMMAGADPSIIGKKGRSVFSCVSAHDDETVGLISNLLEDPEIQRAIAERRAEKTDAAANLAETRRRTRDMSLEARSTAPMRKTMTPADKKRLVEMTNLGGTLRERKEPLAKTEKRIGTRRTPEKRTPVAQCARAKPTEARPWGGSREAEMFQRSIRVEMRSTKKELDEAITELEKEVKKLYNKMFDKLSDDSEGMISSEMNLTGEDTEVLQSYLEIKSEGPSQKSESSALVKESEEVPSQHEESAVEHESTPQ